METNSGKSSIWLSYCPCLQRAGFFPLFFHSCQKKVSYSVTTAALCLLTDSLIHTLAVVVPEGCLSFFSPPCLFPVFLSQPIATKEPKPHPNVLLLLLLDQFIPLRLFTGFFCFVVVREQVSVISLRLAP